MKSQDVEQNESQEKKTCDFLCIKNLWSISHLFTLFWANKWHHNFQQLISQIHISWSHEMFQHDQS